MSEGNVKRKPRNNDKCPVVNKAFMAKVKDRIKKNPLKNMMTMAREINALENTIRKVVHNHLGVKSRSRKRKFHPTQCLKALKHQKKKKLLCFSA